MITEAHTYTERSYHSHDNTIEPFPGRTNQYTISTHDKVSRLVCSKGHSKFHDMMSKMYAGTVGTLGLAHAET